MSEYALIGILVATVAIGGLKALQNSMSSQLGHLATNMSHGQGHPGGPPGNDGHTNPPNGDGSHGGSPGDGGASNGGGVSTGLKGGCTDYSICPELQGGGGRSGSVH